MFFFVGLLENVLSVVFMNSVALNLAPELCHVRHVRRVERRHEVFVFFDQLDQRAFHHVTFELARNVRAGFSRARYRYVRDRYRRRFGNWILEFWKERPVPHLHGRKIFVRRRNAASPVRSS